MKTRRHRSFRKKVTRWFSTENTYRDGGAFTPLSSTSFIPNALLLAIHPRQAVASGDLVELNQRHTIETIRGEILLTGGFNTSPDVSSLVIWHGGIRVVELDPSGAPLLYSPAQPTEADDNWMWLAHRQVMPSTVVGGIPTQPMDSQFIEVHIKSKRVMRDNEALVLYEQCTIAPFFADGITMASQAYLRTLVSRPE